jgi:CheY-like chemotaxis protein
VETSRPLIDEMGHHLTVSLPPNRIVLDGDLTRLAQVFLNLLNNSAKYSKQGGRIELSAELHDGHVVVRVRDSGIGISEEMLSRVFDMFTQADRSLHRSQGGLGIGLTLVRQLVEMHGGSISAFSEGLGKGSEFVVRLPVASSPSPGDHAPSDASELPRSNSQHRVLVVDDNRDSANSLSALIKMLGNEVRTAYDGFEAVEAAAEFQPDVVFLDIGLPRISGYEAAQRIRELPSGNSVFLVALTGWGQDEDRRRSREAGFDRHIVKPVNPDVLEPLLAMAHRG